MQEQELEARRPSLVPGSFYGRVARQRKTSLLTLSVVSHAEARRVPTHGHEHAFVTLLLRGGYQEQIAGKQIVYQPMSVVFHPMGLVHSDEIHAPGADFFTVEVAPAFLCGRLGELPSLRSVRDLSGGPSVWRMLRIFSEFTDGDASDLSLEEPMAELLAALAGLGRGKSRGEPEWLGGVDRALQARYREPLSLGSLASIASVHPVYLSRAFREQRGRSLRATVHGLRVREACRLLQEGLPLAEIALATGFVDQSHFTNVFRRVTGFTPGALRRSLARERDRNFDQSAVSDDTKTWAHSRGPARLEEGAKHLQRRGR